MLVGIILGTVGWEVTDAKFYPQPNCRALQLFIEDEVAGTVTIAAV